MKTLIREGDLVYLTEAIHEVDSVVERDDGLLDVIVVNGGGHASMYTLTCAQAQEALVARDEDMYSSTTLDLRYKESMLMSQIVLMRQSCGSQGVDLQQRDWRQAMMELERTLYVVRFVLNNRGARRVSDERYLSA